MPTQRLTGARIREKRLDRGMRQAALADAAGISPSYLNLIEHNRRRIGGKLLGDLARALGVEPSTLTEGADSDLLDQMRAAAALTGDSAEVARAEELAARYPGWSALIAAQARRIVGLETRVQSLQDRMTHDPQLASALHEVISAVTAIRATASILVGQEKLDADWERRFHENIHADSLRLAEHSGALIAYLETPSADNIGPLTPTEEAEAWLAQTGFHLAALETGAADIDDMIGDAGLSASATPILRAYCEGYVRDAQTLPLDDFAAACKAAQYDPARIAQRFGVGFAQVLRRMTTLPLHQGHPPMGLVVCDASGTVRRLKPVPGFTMPRTGGACPLWPVFTAFSRPSQPIRSEVVLPGQVAPRFLCYTIAEPAAALDFEAASVLQSTMLVLPDPEFGPVPPVPVGTSCRICPRAQCNARREMAIVGLVTVDA
ncbi:helix-turn-helix transcriptional regulator [Yoonia sp.]|uniref:helix-turn-helix transcriptional regulator n=1 Tax=Yoonia sp. TaxID=2212373 RepID=UPI001A0242CF|nr:helix-turn-helix transcriptional regulator [Yoonia sp.]MBE0414623.1 DUF2083 domain-containing protein [Yoonia sp.]